MLLLNMQILNYQFKPKLIPTLVTVLLLPVLVNLGMWQSNKADSKQAKQVLFDKRASELPISIGSVVVDLDDIRFSHVVVRGVYEPELQILLDNQIHNGQVGYHVITPFHISGGSMYILINRGWIPLGSDRTNLPVINTPQGEVEVVGYASDPKIKYLELSKPEALTRNNWQIVWQNLDMKRFESAVGYQLQPILLLMDPDSQSGGFVREWPKPDFKIDMNRGYALQWYFMSIALVVIYVVTNLKKITQQGPSNAEQ